MTTFASINKKCAVCLKWSQQYIKTSDIYIGLPDLDFREMTRFRAAGKRNKREDKDSNENSIKKILLYPPYRIDVCPHCGYCAPGIGAWYTGAKEVVASAEYKAQFNNPDYPEYANYFLCAGMVFEKAEMFDGAGIMSLNAAWVCDDYDEREHAISCRKKAGELLRKAMDMHQRFMEELYEEHLLLADIFRRAGEFLDAMNECKKGMELAPPEIIKKALVFEEELIKMEDTVRHNFGEVEGDYE